MVNVKNNIKFNKIMVLYGFSFDRMSALTVYFGLSKPFNFKLITGSWWGSYPLTMRMYTTHYKVDYGVAK